MSDAHKGHIQDSALVCLTCEAARDEERAALREENQRLREAMRASKAKVMPVWAKLEMWRDDALLLFSAMEILDDAMEATRTRPIGEKDE